MIESQLIYSSTHYKTRVSIQYAEFHSFITVGWLWFLPMILLIIDNVYMKRVYRILTTLIPLVIISIYYSILWKNQIPDDIDFRLFAGFYYRYPYCFDLILSVFIGTIIEIALIEIKAKKTYANTVYKT